MIPIRNRVRSHWFQFGVVGPLDFSLLRFFVPSLLPFEPESPTRRLALECGWRAHPRERA
jgi:hypothetical protein